MSDPEPRTHYISLAAATAIVVASMVGTGVFTSLGFQIGDMTDPKTGAVLFHLPDGHGFPVLALWIVGGIAALCGALSYAELTSMIPRSGGEYHLLGKAYTPFVGFLAGWVSIAAGFSAPIAVAAIAFGKYAQGIWPALAGYLNGLLPSLAHAGYAIPAQLDKTIVALAIVAVLTILQLGGVRFMAKFHVSLTVLKVLLMVAFVVGAFYIGKHPMEFDLLKPKAEDQSSIFSHWFAKSLFYVMFAYSGWNGAVYVAGEMKNAQRNLPLALLLGTVIVMVLYIALNAVFLMGGNWHDMRDQEDVGLIAAQGIFSGNASLWMGALIAFGLLSTVNAMLWTGASTLRVIGQDTRALCWLDASDRRGEPVGAVLFMTNVVLLLLGTSSFSALLNYVQALIQLSSLLCVVAVMWWRFRHPELKRPFRVPLYPLPPLIFIVVSIWMLWVMVTDNPTQTAWGLITLVIGALIYICSPKQQQQEPPSSIPPVPPLGTPEPEAPSTPAA